MKLNGLHRSTNAFQNFSQEVSVWNFKNYMIVYLNISQLMIIIDHQN